jgi:hypothetical protein
MFLMLLRVSRRGKRKEKTRRQSCQHIESTMAVQRLFNLLSQNAFKSNLNKGFENNFKIMGTKVLRAKPIHLSKKL